MNAQDLVSLNYVKSWLSISNSVNTTIAIAISVGQQTVTPLSMANIVVGFLLTVDIGALQEQVLVLATTGTTFTAVFANAHPTTPVYVTGAPTDFVLANLITNASAYMLSRMERTTFQPVTNYVETRNGNGASRIALLNWPVTLVNSVTINGFTIAPATPSSSNGNQAGWVSDNVSVFLTGTWWGGWALLGAGATPGYFPKGRQNVQINYNYNPPTIPFDVQQACVELVALKQTNLRTRVGLRSDALTGIGTSSYITSAEPDSVKSVIDRWRYRYSYE